MILAPIFQKVHRKPRKNRSPDPRIFEKNPLWEIKTLMHNNVSTISDKRNGIDSSDSACDLVVLSMWAVVLQIRTRSTNSKDLKVHQQTMFINIYFLLIMFWKNVFTF